jgi:ATP-dependent helicase/DNAse subunit B
MGHCIYTGSFAALEKRWMDLVSELQREDPLLEINVLVGSNILATYLKHRFAKTGSALANVRFHTFLDLARRVSGGAHPAQKKPRIPHLGTSIILEEILAHRTPEVFAPLSASPGFRDTLLETFRDLRDADITPEKLDRALESSREMKNRPQNLAALADLYRRYREKVHAFHDVDDDFRTAISWCSRAAQRRGIRQVMVYGVYDVTGQQARLLSALKDAVEMTYFIPYVDPALSGFAQPFLQACTRDLGVERVPLTESPRNTELDRLAARGFGLIPATESGDRNQALVSDGSYALVSVPGESRAAVEVVREIVRALRDGTIGGFHEAAVIVRQPEADIPVLREMFRLRGIPYFIHGGASYAERLLSRAVTAIMDLASNAFSRESILTAMEMVAASQPDRSASSWDVQTWRAMLNDSRFLGGIRTWDTGIDAVVEEARKKFQKAETRDDAFGEDEEEEHGALSAASAAKRLETATSLQNGWRNFRQAVTGWPQALCWREWADFLSRRLEPLLGASEDWHSFSNVLDKIANLQGVDHRPVSLDTLKDTLFQSIQSLAYPVGRFQRSGVNILSTTAARGLRFSLVIIPDLDEGRFPAKLRQDPLLLDSERRCLENLPLKKKRLDEERLLFDMAARSAEKRLVLMTSRLEESSDRERIPSQFFMRAAAAVQGSIVAIRALAPDTVPGFRSVSLDNPAPVPGEAAVDEGEIRLRLIVSGKYTARSALSALADLEPFRFNGPLAYDHARWERRLTPYDGYIRENRLAQWMATTLRSREGQVSASRIESYAKCPYYYFLKYGQELESWEEPEPVEAIDPLERGLIVHSILERFMGEHSGEAFIQTPDEELQHSMEELAKDAFRQSRPAGIADLLWEIECDTLLFMLCNWLVFEKSRAQEGLLPAQLELIFGEFSPEQRSPAYCVLAGKHRYDFRGRIDRVDLSSDGKRARVVDYKTGTLPPSMKGKSRTPLMGGERIQLAVYGGALSVLDRFRSVESVEGEYLHLQPRDARIAPCAFTCEELERASGRLPEVLAIIGEGIQSGVFPARTSGMLRPSGHCEYCDYVTICGKDRVQREERKADDPMVRKFLRIKELT